MEVFLMETMLIHLEVRQKEYLMGKGYREASAHIRKLIDMDMEANELNIDTISALVNSIDEPKKPNPLTIQIRAYDKLDQNIKDELHAYLKPINEKIYEVTPNKSKAYNLVELRKIEEAIRRGYLKEVPPIPPEEKR
jgi:hypothetical protein